MKKEYLIFDMDGTLVDNGDNVKKVIFGTIEKHFPDYLDKAKYLFSTHGNLRLDIFLNEIFDSDENICKFLDEEIKFQFIEINNQTEFFPGIIEKIRELSQNYKLFLTTSSPTHVAINHLEKGGIINHFELIYGSDKILKGREHLELFKNHSEDEIFFEKSIYIGDGDNDKYFASEFNIDFIRVGKFGKDKYEIDSVAEIDEILEIYKN